MPIERLITGLGNPGPRYADTPHNVGFEVVDALAARWRAAAWQGWKGKVAVAEATVDGIGVLLAKPSTYMNLSGEAVAPLLRYRGLEREALLVICDDFALPIGRTRLRGDGTSGGQRGLQNIIDHLGSVEFARLRLGVAPAEGLPCPGEMWVLSKWSPGRRAHVDRVIEQAVACVETWVVRGTQAAMNEFNGQTVPGPEEA